jgi:hypothetical protein
VSIKAAVTGHYIIQPGFKDEIDRLHDQMIAEYM